ncbi:MAG TPA: Crp/Fnr family transcriptional regulator [Sulfuricurvum sp.]|nr:Crp/Fnr family transcriptional regulator [Sulfuricurvum sp.]
MLETIEIFSHLSPVQLQQLEAISLCRHYASGEIIFYQGDQSEYFHFLLEGDVSVYKSNDTGTLEVHRFRGPSMFAESATLQGIPFPASAEALCSCTILKLHRSPFLKLLHEDAGLSIALITSLSKKIVSLQRLNDQLSAPDALSKIVRLMSDRPDIFSTLKGIEIAKIAGIAPETLSRILTKLKKEKLILFKPRQLFEIIDKNGLQKYR